MPCRVVGEQSHPQTSELQAQESPFLHEDAACHPAHTHHSSCSCFPSEPRRLLETSRKVGEDLRWGSVEPLPHPPGSQQECPLALHSHLSQVGHRCAHTLPHFIQQGQEGTPICSGQNCPVRHRMQVGTASELSVCWMNE